MKKQPPASGEPSKATLPRMTLIGLKWTGALLVVIVSVWFSVTKHGADSTVQNSTSMASLIPVRFEPAGLDFGCMQQDETATRNLRLTNVGTNDLLITAAHSNCGCTLLTTNIVGTVLPAKQTITAALYFDSAKRQGIWSSLLTVRCDDLITKQCYVVQLEVTGEVLTDFSIEPPALIFGEIASGETATRYVTLLPKNCRTLSATHAISSTADFQASIVKQPSTSATSNSSVLVKVELKAPAFIQRAIITAAITVSTACPQMKTTMIPVSACVLPRVEVSPQVLVRRANPSTQLHAPGRLTIRSFDISHLEDVVRVHRDGRKTSLPLDGSNNVWQRSHLLEIPADVLVPGDTLRVTVVTRTAAGGSEASHLSVPIIGL